MPALTTIAFRQGTAAQWTTANPVLASGEPGFETDTNKQKIGDGTSTWSALPYQGSGGGTAGGDLTGTYPNPTLAAVGTAGTYGSASQIPVIITDTKGRVTGVTNTAVAIANTAVSGLGTASTKNIPATGNASTSEVVYGTDTRLTDSRTPTGTATGDLTGTYPAPILAAVGTAGTYGSATQVPVIVTDTKGRVTGVTNTAIAIPESAVTNLVTDLAAKAPLNNPTFTRVASLIEGGQINFEPSTEAGASTWFIDSWYNGTSTQLRIGNGATVIGSFDPAGAFTVPTGSIIPMTGNTTEAPIDFTPSASVVASPSGGELEFDGATLTLVPNTSVGRVPIAAPLFTSGLGTSGVTLNTNYALFPAAQDTITLPIGTYKVDLSFQVSNTTAGTTAATINLNMKGAGTALGSMTWDGTASITLGGAASEFQVASTALGTAMVVTPSSAVTGRAYVVRGSGILKVTTAGTIIPAYQWSATVTGTAVVYADNYMMITPLSGSGTTVKTGNWA